MVVYKDDLKSIADLRKNALTLELNESIKIHSDSLLQTMSKRVSLDLLN